MIKNENFLHICGWMINELNLKGNELVIYSVIHGFSQDGKSDYHGGLNYLCEWTQSTKQGVIKCLKSLVEKGLLIKQVESSGGKIRYCRYWTAKSRSENDVLNSNNVPAENPEEALKESDSDKGINFERSTKFTAIQVNSGKQSLPDRSTKFTLDGKQSLPNKNSENKFKNLSSFENGNSKQEETEKCNVALFQHSVKQNVDEQKERQTEIFKILKNLFGNTELFSADFVPKLEQLCSERSLEPEKYISWTYEHLQKKSVSNFPGYFFRTILSETNVSLYFFERSQEKNKDESSEIKKERTKTKCKVCGAEHLLYADCHVCGLSYSERDNKERIAFYKKCYMLPAGKRKAMDNEIMEMQKESHISVWNTEKNKIYKKYGVI